MVCHYFVYWFIQECSTILSQGSTQFKWNDNALPVASLLLLSHPYSHIHTYKKCHYLVPCVRMFDVRYYSKIVTIEIQLIFVIHFFVLYATHRFILRKCEFSISGIREFSCWNCCENDLNVMLLLALIWQYSLIIRNTQCRILYAVYYARHRWVSLIHLLVNDYYRWQYIDFVTEFRIHFIRK